MTFRARHALPILGCLTPLFACSRDLTLHVNSQRCYHLHYSKATKDDPGALFAEFVLIEPGVDSGDVRSGASVRDTSGFWKMFLVGGRWQHDSANLVLRFSNGFSGVVYRFEAAAGDTLKGQMRFLYDVVNQRPPQRRWSPPISGARMRIS